MNNVTSTININKTFIAVSLKDRYSVQYSFCSVYYYFTFCSDLFYFHLFTDDTYLFSKHKRLSSLQAIVNAKLT